MITHLHFGTDGIRGTFDARLFSADKLHTLGVVMGAWLCETTTQPKIIIIADTRHSGDYIKSALSSGLLLNPLHVLDCGILPTSAAPHLMRHYDAHATIIISASHNKYSDNGIKIITRRGKLTQEQEAYIIAQVNQQKSADFSRTGKLYFMHDAAAHYVQTLVNLFPKKFLAQRHIVLDTAHGACSRVAYDIFTACGAEVIMLNNEPSGYNINAQCGSLFPEVLQQEVVRHNADAGFAFDGDGDRVIAVSRDGQLKNGDDILALLAEHPRYRSLTTLVGTVMSNQALEEHFKASGKKFLRAPVGDKYVMSFLEEHNLVLGGEQSGHIILRDISPIGDGILTALTLLETMHETSNWSCTTFTPFPQFLFNITVKERKPLHEEPFARLIKDVEKNIQPGRLLVRYSGTEPLLRVMIEGPEKEKAHAVGARLVHELSLLI